MSATKKMPIFRVGDQVKVPFGLRTLKGVIVEDRGAIGVNRRRLFQVNVPMDPFDPMTIELPEDQIQSIGESDLVSQISKEKITDYLVNGGLIAILQSNTSGGKHQPRVWLCLGNLENVTHTFTQERGIVGGETVPFWAIQEDKIFTPKKQAVVSFIESFGLTHLEAEKVVAEVGTAP